MFQKWLLETQDTFVQMIEVLTYLFLGKIKFRVYVHTLCGILSGHVPGEYLNDSIWSAVSKQ